MTTCLSVGTCIPRRRSTVAPRFCLLDASRISASRRARSLSSVARRASRTARCSDWPMPIVRRQTIDSAINTKAQRINPTRLRPRNPTLPFATLVTWRCASAGLSPSRCRSASLRASSRVRRAPCRGSCISAASAGKCSRGSIRASYA